MTSAAINKQKAVAAAIRRFPHFELPIRRLFEVNETFRDICEELRDAEFALSATASTPTPLRETRQAEWQDLVDRLASEVEAMIGRDYAARSPRTI